MRNQTAVLAKSSSKGRPPMTLTDHTSHVIDAFVALFGVPDEPSPLAERWLAFFRLTSDHLPDFLRHGLVAAYIHDWGKANAGFQEVGIRQVQDLVIAPK